MANENLGGLIGKSVRNATIDPSSAGNNTKKLMSPNAKDDPDAITSDNPQKEWTGGSGKPSGPYGQQGKNF